MSNMTAKERRQALELETARLRKHLDTTLSQADTQPYSDHDGEPDIREGVLFHVQAQRDERKQKVTHSAQAPSGPPVPPAGLIQRGQIIPETPRRKFEPRAPKAPDPDQDLVPPVDPQDVRVQVAKLEGQIRRLEESVFHIRAAARDIANGQLLHFKVTKGMLEGPKFGCMMSLMGGACIVFGIGLGMVLIGLGLVLFPPWTWGPPLGP